jgi:small GTP-binding protein
MSEEYDFLFKSIVVGDGGVGKTALTLRFSKGFFTEDYKMTIGVDFHVKTITIDTPEGPIKAKLQIWDTGGQERFSSIRPMYYRGSLGALLIFDLTNSDSFEHLPQWIEEIRTNVKGQIPLLLVGNKSDLSDERALSLEEINHFTREFNLYYMETSAKTGEGVGDCFHILACLMIGSGVPDQLISDSIVFPPGQILTVPSKEPPAVKAQLFQEQDYSAPPVPEPTEIKPYISTSKLKTEPKFDYEAPPVPEPNQVVSTQSNSIFELESEPEVPIPQPKIEENEEELRDFEFKTPDEILAEEAIKTEGVSFIELSQKGSESETYKPKAIPFSSNVPIPAPPPEGFQPTQEEVKSESTPESKAPFIISKKAETSKPTPVSTHFDKPVKIEPEVTSESLVDYMPETIISKKEKKKLAKQKKKEKKKKAKEEKEKKIKEEREKQEKLIEQMKKVKKEKKVEPKKEEKEEVKTIIEKPVGIATKTEKQASTPSLFQTLTKKPEEITQPVTSTPFIPFVATKKPKEQESSKLKVIPDVADLEIIKNEPPKKPIQKDVQKTPGKEIIICKQCGAILSSDYAYCNKCGQKL